MKVKSGTARRVMDALADDERTADASIDVVADGGVITLTGGVPSEGVREAAEEIAKDQKGVASVVSDLEVTGEAHSSGPPFIPPPKTVTS